MKARDIPFATDRVQQFQYGLPSWHDLLPRWRSWRTGLPSWDPTVSGKSVFLLSSRRAHRQR